MTRKQTHNQDFDKIDMSAKARNVSYIGNANDDPRVASDIIPNGVVKKT